MAKLSLVPSEKKFFELFEKQAAKVKEGTELFSIMLQNYTDVEEKAREIKVIENEADDITHEIIDLLHRTFITPFDRGDIHSLAGNIDEVLDYTESVAAKFYIYDKSEPTDSAVKLAEIIDKSAFELEKAIKHIRKAKECKPHLKNIHRLEGEADVITRQAIVKLFQKENDPIRIIKWKAIYRQLESTTDICSKLAHIIEGILVKNA